jgi:predicted homoserine dehydrogenase-like protein
LPTALDGDQPGTQLNLYRFVAGLGFRPLVCGNIKGLQDHTRTPDTQRGFAEQWGISPLMATSFADGTKISFEQTVVANDVGFRVAQRGMVGPEHRGPIEEVASQFDVEDLLENGGIVDYALGATPSPGVFVLGAHDDRAQRAYMEFWKQGPGPLYTFYVPYHLAHMEAPTSVARAVLFGDATSTARDVAVEVVAIAKRELAVGERLDGIGGFTVYGQCENSTVARAEGLLPIGLADDCRVRKRIEVNRPVTLDEVELPPGRLRDELWQDQMRRAV